MLNTQSLLWNYLSISEDLVFLSRYVTPGAPAWAEQLAYKVSLLAVMEE